MAHLAEWNDGERVFRLYKRGAQPWEPWGGGHPEYDTYAYVVTDKHDNLIIPGRGVSMDYYHTPDDAMRGQGRVMRLHKQWGEEGESRAMPTLDPAAILASYRAVCERTESCPEGTRGGAEDFATVTAWIPALVERIAKYAEKCGEIEARYYAIEWEEGQCVSAEFESRIMEVGFMASIDRPEKP